MDEHHPVAPGLAANADLTAPDWRMAARLVARMTVGMGLLLVAAGAFKAAALYRESSRGLETLANIDGAVSPSFSASSRVDLSWQDPAGATRQAYGVEVTSGLSHKLRLGSVLPRAQMRIRYWPAPAQPGVLVVEDVPEYLKRAAVLSISGFLAVAAGSFLSLWLLLFERGAAAGKNRASRPGLGGEA